MEQDIYLDVYFSFNFLMDFFVLFLTGIIIKNNKKSVSEDPKIRRNAFYYTFFTAFRFYKQSLSRRSQRPRRYFSPSDIAFRPL